MFQLVTRHDLTILDLSTHGLKFSSFIHKRRMYCFAREQQAKANIDATQKFIFWGFQDKNK